MSRSLLRAFVLAAIAGVTAPAVASAQIYTWRDDAGNLVVSKTPKAGAGQTYAVVNVTSGFRTTQPVASRKAQRFEPLIQEFSAAQNVRADLVRAVIHAESAFNPFARSHKGAMGLMQLMPATATELGVTDPYDPAQNIRGGVTYLKSLLDKYSGNEELALAAYNAGPGAVAKYGTVPPYRETRNYVARIKGQANVRAGGGKVQRKVEIVDGREVTRFVTSPGSASAPATARHANHR